MDTIDPALRAACHQHLRQLGMPVGFQLSDLLQAVADKRGRSLTLLPAPPTDGLPAGMLIATAGCDVIRFPSYTTELHRNHVISRQISHALLGHQRDLGQFTTGSFPGDGNCAHNRQAEVLTTMLLMRSTPVVTRPSQDLRAAIPRINQLLAFLERALGPAAQQLRLPELDHHHGLSGTYRKVIRIRDTQMLLAPYTHPDAPENARSEMRGRDLPVAQRSAIVEAAVLATALVRFQDRTRTPTDRRVAVPAAAPRNLPSEIEHLAMVYQALTTDHVVAAVVKNCIQV
ncbi:DUF6545 domain-containing protein [Amycolatopsis tucumanensis]|uniref:DUF6545 domain-containing protein n=1 Tax=Amycolatopsis tucumanensis TaxID=401106 RepID=A0ABP7HL53_9PSEU|nr:DUF6545 domain-containing protein [Amycolatopsis tucumanensis]MCF6423678.1 hypothetical protein [Amycolatopsis tucumanensis]